MEMHHDNLYQLANQTQFTTTTGCRRSVSPRNGRKERSLHYCHICSKGFKDNYSVNVHVKTHTNEESFSCSICSKRFRLKAHLAKHYQTHNSQQNSSPNSTVTSSVVQQQQSQQQQPHQQPQQQRQVQTSDSVIYATIIYAVASTETEILGI
ncbi:hypothetical protein TKK_0004969 [Trichogramma kaykai]|uniref:C2H2-type domain-containing protein n=1 Tax=Trichogramma kaykai TaxID=54128 RepID=A0ABD2XJ06_9HYME